MLRNVLLGISIIVGTLLGSADLLVGESEKTFVSTLKMRQYKHSVIMILGRLLREPILLQYSRTFSPTKAGVNASSLQTVKLDAHERCLLKCQLMHLLDAQDASVLNQLIPQYLNDCAADVRAAAAAALGQVRPKKQALPWLLRALGDQDALVRCAALYSLEHLDLPVEQLVGLLRLAWRDPDEEVRAAAAWVAGHIQGADALVTTVVVPALVDLVTHEDGMVRDHAVQALGELNQLAAQAVPTLVTCLQDSTEEPVVLNALVNICRHSADGRRALRQAFAPAPMCVKRLLIAIWGELRPYADEVVPQIIQCLAEPELKGAARAALVKMGPLSLPWLKRALDAAEVNVEVIAVLERLGPGAMALVPELTSLLEHQDRHVRIQALLALGEIMLARTK